MKTELERQIAKRVADVLEDVLVEFQCQRGIEDGGVEPRVEYKFNQTANSISKFLAKVIEDQEDDAKCTRYVLTPTEDNKGLPHRPYFLNRDTYRDIVWGHAVDSVGKRQPEEVIEKEYERLDGIARNGGFVDGGFKIEVYNER